MELRLDGKVAIITGAASGLGLSIAEKYARSGANVVIADLNPDQAREVAAGIAKRNKVTAVGILMDVTSEEQVNEGVQKIANDLGTVDILVSNAGIQTIAPIVEFDYDDWKRLLDIHINGTFLTTKACMQQMIRSGRGGSIIIMGSIHSVEASMNKSAYVTAKHGLLGFTRALAKEGAIHNIRANLIGPGFVKTPLVEKQIPEQAKALGISEEEVVKNVMLGNTVTGEFTTLDDIAVLALMFAAFPSNGLTGQSMLATHGWHMA
ncbi:3-hydroxybutyrate dehydrogenase [Piscirickettsia salmonis]|uniref:D-beta-hydroxybutyrate dehydrogenase n=1 Tax=Piscirickettsia salmonis TaxID=1238 RepID=A0A9Q5VAN1_PISSA|nr:3-hydroxybutyrate dehydrogenase [Piscirickettsia salmonis]ALA26212.1 short chain dehydrogenase family protein [Piscirickettsia salmonis]APS43652.1 3-hydroxybutyrate dehydrogenase [Piscirickettsia salmonis]APS47007.1 3-hydroxybutyrate dehydrogenase [Piscirickettsia salmonis]APS51545.1 3-hydroxybutyrate dehydrogenase [Piscirickettsia salmonis]APS54758.1 3-hydroxybutyrate dehydrogenase [Piscirickettsia salmonis]